MYSSLERDIGTLMYCKIVILHHYKIAGFMCFQGHNKVVVNIFLQVSLVNESVEKWKGPEKPVDLILASHVFYHVADKLAAVKKLFT